ncbi:hypothetical protein [Actinoplanes sp. NPDC026619]|uniref:hypothetical protein n=1 Tax=Actinoplanes sp. NPDC026619 TaxID=3155798 RepID=UPI0033F55B11
MVETRLKATNVSWPTLPVQVRYSGFAVFIDLGGPRPVLGPSRSASRLVDELATARAQLAIEHAGTAAADTDRLRTELAIHVDY